MAAYVVSSLAELKDPDLMSKYAETAIQTVAAHGGKFLAITFNKVFFTLH